MHIGEFLKKFREHYKQSQVGLATEIGLENKYRLEKWEQLKGTPKERDLLLIKKYFGVEALDHFTEDYLQKMIAFSDLNELKTKITKETTENKSQGQASDSRAIDSIAETNKIIADSNLKISESNIILARSNADLVTMLKGVIVATGQDALVAALPTPAEILLDWAKAGVPSQWPTVEAGVKELHKRYFDRKAKAKQVHNSQVESRAHK